MKKTIISRAIKEAKSSDVVRGKVGAVLFTDQGHILTSSHNVILLGGLPKKTFTIHAEQYLLSKAFRLKAIERFKKLNVLVLRYKPGTKKLANAKPCKNCRFLLKKAGVRVFYTDDLGQIQEMNHE